MTERSTPPPPAPQVRVANGKIVAVGGFLLVAAAAAFTWFEVPRFVVPFYEQRPRQMTELFDHLEAGLRQYHTDHGTLPPENDLLLYRRRNKNAARTEAFGMSTFQVGSLTTPTAYWNIRAGGDPYALPDQFTPPAYFLFESREGAAAVLSSGGPNLKYEIRPETVSEATDLSDLELRLKALGYDPTNGARSGGDFFRLIRF